jgi:hypothetical protein
MLIALIFYGQKIHDKSSMAVANQSANYDYEVILKKGGKKYYNTCQLLTDSVTVFVRESQNGQCSYDTLHAKDITNITILKPQWK